MNIKQLSILFLAISISAVQSVVADEIVMKNKKQPARADMAKQERTKKIEPKKKVEPKKRAKKSRGTRRVAKKPKIAGTIAKIGAFDRNGSIKSFSNASKGLINFMNSKGEKLTDAEKVELFRELARFNWITGHEGFDTPAHYELTIELLQNASKHSALFGTGTVRLKFINRWLDEKEEQLKDPSKRVTSKKVTSKKVTSKKVTSKKVTSKKVTSKKAGKVSPKSKKELKNDKAVSQEEALKQKLREQNEAIISKSKTDLETLKQQADVKRQNAEDVISKQNELIKEQALKE